MLMLLLFLHISIHYNGRFYQIVPWTGDMGWEVDPWGRWRFSGRCDDKQGERQFEAEVLITTDSPGVLLRAPTKDEGMVRGHVALLLLAFIILYSNHFPHLNFSSNTSAAILDMVTFHSHCGNSSTTKMQMTMFVHKTRNL